MASRTLDLAVGRLLRVQRASGLGTLFTVSMRVSAAWELGVVPKSWVLRVLISG